MPKNRCFFNSFLIILFACFLVGCSINIDIDFTRKDPSNQVTGITQNCTYQSQATIMLFATSNTESSITSSDLIIPQSILETLNSILQSEHVQGKLNESFPGVEYTIVLEPSNASSICAIIITSSTADDLVEICNMAATLICEKIPEVIDGYSCKIVDLAKSTQSVETN